MKSEKTDEEIKTALSKLGTVTHIRSEELLTFTDDEGIKYEVVKRHNS